MLLKASKYDLKLSYLLLYWFVKKRKKCKKNEYFCTLKKKGNDLLSSEVFIFLISEFISLFYWSMHGCIMTAVTVVSESSHHKVK